MGVDNLIDRHDKLMRTVLALETFAFPWHDPDVGALNIDWHNIVGIGGVSGDTAAHGFPRGQWAVIADRVAFRGTIHHASTTPDDLFAISSQICPRAPTQFQAGSFSLTASPNGIISYTPPKPPNFTLDYLDLGGAHFPCGNLA